MRVQYLSDLHFEFHADDGEGFVASMDPTDVDVLVIAGDLAVGEGIASALDRFCRRYEAAKVLYVHGNHEYYGSDRASVVAISREAARRNANLHWLDADVVTIGGQRFAGAPMWFRHPGKAEVLKMMMSDFHRIRDFEQWVYAENARALAFFERELTKGDVAITHYLPIEASVHEKWKGDPLNPYFLCDVEPILRAKKPFAWIHGHTHESVDVIFAGETKVACNPFGYVGHELNRAFVDKAILEIPL